MRSVSELGDLRGKRVLVRSDFNVPLKDGVITDDGRIRAALPTLQALLGKGARVVVTAHLGRPTGEGFEAKYSLAPVATRLGELLGDVGGAADGELLVELTAPLGPCGRAPDPGDEIPAAVAGGEPPDASATPKADDAAHVVGNRRAVGEAASSSSERVSASSGRPASNASAAASRSASSSAWPPRR